MARLLLVVPSATYRADAFLTAARRLGVEVVVACEQPLVMAPAMGARALTLPLHDPEAAAEVVVHHDAVAPLDAVVAVDDAGTSVAASAGARLGLPHNPPEAVAAARDKLVMRARLTRAEVPQPAFAPLPPGEDPALLSAALAAVGLPCVIKPATLSASQGVLRADTPEEASAAAVRVRRIATAAGVDPAAPLVVESFVPGAEVALEGLVTGGELSTLAVFDKPDPLDGPAFEETIYVTPSRLAAADRAAVLRVARAAVAALGLRHGPVHAELRVREGRATVLEVAARTIGGLCSLALSFSTGQTLEELVLAHALGWPVEHTAAPGASGVLMVPTPGPGTFLGVDGVQAALEVPGVTGVRLTVTAGTRVVPVPEGNRYLGFVFARDRTPGRVERALRRAWSCLEVRIDPAAESRATS